MADWITTYGGTHIIPTDPKPELIHHTDFAHALSLICRGNGQVKTFYSVGQHCIACAREAKNRNYPSRLVLACLLHDAAEAYLSDVPRPFKKGLTGYAEVENRMLAMIYEKYLGKNLTEEEERMVKVIDDDLLYYDLRDLLNEPQDRPEPVLHHPYSHKVEPFETVEATYLALFDELCKEL